MDSHFVGIDISKLHLDVAVRVADGRKLARFGVENTAKGHAELIARLPAGALVAYEPTAAFSRASLRSDR